ncbi:MAG: YggT family protein [Gemmatimonadetes bacterium]|nr:YggT family protein [Gemmatimonadota bacterium]MYK98628.1 YggT family protein [Gemmatimonadota bacterium]
MGLIEFIINIYMLAFGLRLFMPAASPFSENPIQRGLYTATEPVLRPIRQVIMRGEPRFDWSPVFAIIALVIVRGFLVTTVMGVPLSTSLAAGMLDVFDFVVRVIAILFLGAFFISIESPFAFSQSGHMMHNIAHFFLAPIRRFTGYRIGRPDVSALLGIVLLGVLHGLVLYQAGAMVAQAAGAPVDMILESIVYVIDFIFDVLFIVILVRAVLSFFNPDTGNALFQILILFSDPILAPIRRIMPSTYGIDFSPLIAILILRFIQVSLLPLLLRI